jgi:DNA-binding transcriptional LysR family regulator
MSTVHEMPSLELRDLRLVLAIARRGGLGAAARHLHLTQSALSHHLRALEERLGVSVFDRVGRGLVVNARGARLVELADRLLLTHELPAAELAWARASLGRSFSSLRHAERVPLTEAMVALARAGEGIALMGLWTIKTELASGALVARPLRPRLRRPFAVVSVRERPADPRADILAAVLRAWSRDAEPAAIGARSRSVR